MVLLAVDPDLGGAVAALSWRNPPAAPEDGGSSSSSVGGDGLLPLPAGHQLQVEVHDMPLEVWRYGTGREKRQPDAAGLINILRRYGGAGIGGGTEVAVPASSTPAHSTPKSSSGSGKKRGKRKAAAEGDAATADAAPGEAAAALAEPSQQPDPDAAAAPPAGFALEEDEEPPLIRAVMEYNMPAQLSGKYAW